MLLPHEVDAMIYDVLEEHPAVAALYHDFYETQQALRDHEAGHGELVFRQRLLHSGIVLSRLAGLKPETKAELVVTAFAQHADDLSLRCAVLSRQALRLRKRPL